MPDVRDARVKKSEASETFSRSRYTAFSRSRAAGRPGREAFPEGPNEAIAEFTTVGRSHMQETRVTSTREWEVACESDKRDRDTPFSQRSQRNRWNKFHTVVLDHAVGVSHENRETEGSRTTQWQQHPRKFRRSQQTKLW